jgi:hypothetical protein
MASTRSRKWRTRSRATSRTARGREVAGLAKNLRIGDDGKYHWYWDPRFIARPIDVKKRLQRFEACAS